MEQARQFPGQEREIWDYYRKNPAALASVRAPMYEEKVVDFLVELAKVTEKPVSREELYQEDERLRPELLGQALNLGSLPRRRPRARPLWRACNCRAESHFVAEPCSDRDTPGAASTSRAEVKSLRDVVAPDEPETVDPCEIRWRPI